MFPGMLLYAVIAVIAAIDLAWVLGTDITLDQSSIIAAFSRCAAFGVAALTLRLLRHQNLLVDHVSYRHWTDTHMAQAMRMFEGLFFICLAWIFVRMFNHLTMTIPLPLTDELLLAWDRAFYLDWNAYFDFIISHDWLASLFGRIYTSLTALSIIAFTLLMLTRREREAQFFIASFVITCLLCIIIGLFFPALGAVKTLYTGTDSFAMFYGHTPGVIHIPYMEALRTNKNITINLMDLPGLVTFPSFHTACGILLIWCFRRNPLSIPVTLYAVLMIASTPILGGHYFVDLLGGTFIALAICAALMRLPYFRGSFTRRPKETVLNADVVAA